MLSIGKLANGQEGYYLDAVARGVEDYYLEGEAPGRWLGAGTALLGLAGEVDPDALATVLDGGDPTTDTDFGARKVRSKPGTRPPGEDRSGVPDVGSRPSSTAASATESTSPSSPNRAVPAPSHRPGASPST